MSEFTNQCVRILNDKKLQIEAAIIRCTLKVKADAIRMTPSDSANLRGSAFSKVEPIDGVLTGTVGYTAVYAGAVHEAKAQKLKGKKRASGRGTYWNNGEPEFLKKAMEKNANYIKAQIKAALK
jgi:hypothetical protein